MCTLSGDGADMSAIPLLRLLVAGVSTMTLVPLVSLVFVYNTKPDIIIKAIRKAVIWRAGLTVKFVTVDGYRFAYGERGRPSETQPSILFLHGFSTSKDTWARFITALPKNLHIITLDLPGHGESDRNPSQDLSMEGQANTVHRFVCAVGLDRKPLHLVGTSMGGGIAGLYAATYRKSIALLTLFCPLGVVPPVHSRMMAAFLEGRNMLVPKTIDDFREMTEINSYRYKIGKLKLPDQLLYCALADRTPHNDFFQKLSDELGRKEKWDVLQRSMGNISAPTHVIWGREDDVLDVSGADILREGVPNCRLDILDDCGHVAVNERTRQAVAVFMNFREGVLNGYKK
ncbi:ABHD6 [Branchiostoma lanceolatum]|uniref:acylglycerol lipase n=1 Tax=Branchiostoma lanceolatum TaxID=7740 RepID=A0A8K0ABN8_BRALA|nr:ABHD6 [Branchiostoma lanceolatum]